MAAANRPVSIRIRTQFHVVVVAAANVQQLGSKSMFLKWDVAAHQRQTVLFHKAK